MKRFVLYALLLSVTLHAHADDPGGYFLVFTFNEGRTGEPVVMATERYHSRPAQQVPGWQLRVLDKQGAEVFRIPLGDPLVHVPAEGADDARQMSARIPRLDAGAWMELIEPGGTATWRGAIDAHFRSRAAATASATARLAGSRRQHPSTIDLSASPAAKAVLHEPDSAWSGSTNEMMESVHGFAPIDDAFDDYQPATMSARPTRKTPTYLPDEVGAVSSHRSSSFHMKSAWPMHAPQGPMQYRTEADLSESRIVGRVLDDSGRAPGVAFDALIYSGDSQIQEIRVDGDGTYAFDANPERRLRIWLQPPAPFVPAWRDLMMSDGDEKSMAVAAVTLDDGVVLTIRPRDPTGQSLLDQAHGGWIYTGPDFLGSFGFSADQSAWDVMVPRGQEIVINFEAQTGNRFKPDIGPRTFDADTTIEPVFHDIRRLHGIIRREDGTAHAGAIVRAFERSTGDYVVSTRSLVDGSYEMNLRSGVYDLEVDARSNQSSINLLYVTPTGPQAVSIDQVDVERDLTLVVPSRKLIATIISKSELPPPRVTVFSDDQLLSRTFASRRTSECLSAECVTGVDLAIEPGVYDFEIETVDANGLHTSRHNDIDLRSTDVAIEYETSGEDKRWHGTLLKPNGTPSTGGYAFSLDTTGQIRDNAPLDEQGRFAIAVARGWVVGFQPARIGTGLRETIQVTSPEDLPATVRHSSIASPTFDAAAGLYEIHKGEADQRVRILLVGDGYTDARETFTDTNGNGVWDGVLWYDFDKDGVLDSDEPHAVYGDAPEPVAGTDAGSANEPFEDSNGDGYLSQDDETVLVANAQSQIRSLLGADYWSAHRDAFEAHVAFVTSPQAGMDVIDREGQALLERDTILGGALLRERNVLHADREAALLLAERLSPGFDYLVILLNQPIPYGRANTTLGSIPGSMLTNGGTLANYPDSNTFGHEAGHFIGLLADEYDEFPSTSDGYEPPLSNVTTRIRYDEIKWRRWLTPDQELPSPAVPTDGIGLFEGANYLKGGVYRPSWNSIMRGGHGFDVSALDALDAGLARFTGAAPSLNQFALTGNWYEPVNSGQGLSLEIFQDASGNGQGSLFGGWFTFDTASGGTDRQRWYILSGPVASRQSSAELTIHANYAGNFDAPPATKATAVGTARLVLESCTTAVLEYAFDDGRTGTIELHRLLDDVACTIAGLPASAVPADFSLSGNWYDPDTSGQGLIFEVNPVARQFFATWFTYAPDGAAVDDSVSQRWYAFQAPIGSDPKRYDDFEIYLRRGGIFDDPHASEIDAVGIGSLRFDSCTRATLEYEFESGDNAGLSGSIDLSRPGPTPEGCDD